MCGLLLGGFMAIDISNKFIHCASYWYLRSVRECVRVRGLGRIIIKCYADILLFQMLLLLMMMTINTSILLSAFTMSMMIMCRGGDDVPYLS